MTENDADRLLHLRRPGRLLRRARAGHPRERRRPGRCGDPDAVRADRARRRSTTPGSRRVIPHELTHLVFDTAVDNPYHFPPRWLNEGLAVYESEGYGSGDRGIGRGRGRERRRSSRCPGSSGQFPTSGDRFRLAYAESVSAIDYLVRTHGQDALVALIGSYADGRTDDEAFEAGDRAWTSTLRRGLAGRPRRRGADAATVRSPRRAGPLPPGGSRRRRDARCPDAAPTRARPATAPMTGVDRRPVGRGRRRDRRRGRVSPWYATPASAERGRMTRPGSGIRRRSRAGR